MIQLEIERRSKIYAKHTSLYNKRCVSQVIENSFGTLFDILIYLLLSYTHIKNSEPQNLPQFPSITL